MLRTPLCDLLGIIYPIIQGGMAWVATGELAAAVSAAGGLGIIGAGSAPPEVVRQEIRKVRERTDRPFGVNIYYMSPYVEELVDLVCAEKVPVVTTGAGNPGKHLPRFKEAGVKVIPVVASVALAKRLEHLGVDALVAEGMECGGHIGEIATMPLVPQIVDAVHIPVIAAGGFADGRGLAAALALGAVGVQMGTRFICATECTVHERYKKAVLKAGDRDAVVTGMAGHYVRVLKNKLTRQFEELAARGATWEEMDRLGSGKLRAAVIDGDVEYGSVMAGQSAAMVREIKPAAAIIAEVMAEAEAVITRLGRLLGNA
ncbi:enoyl-[acyl-carrier-protein] reductase FabK [Moorella sp. Hama-1]|uniref:enoyl-[acyl-carrier-protein] reductase FabK n=1 Tax=Moorella sp. Hama-1 TaxID=2138101 RepID=UPI000D65E9BD|nr:enoyl-[acyl-carrier-protein] reductase FabK [Moorella sp. Hama-1]MDN5361074.1 enoyl-[acyl-carrier protein] reductase [Moorella sp. (in: firmicutes)]BCV21009.1 2-nitropropane dioxygenase [Moorella sp. Hama-1]